MMRPLRDGVIADYEVTEAMLRYFLTKINSRTVIRGPEVMISVPYGVTSVEKRAVHEAILQAGARVAYLISEPLAAAIGAGPACHHPRRKHDPESGRRRQRGGGHGDGQCRRGAQHPRGRRASG